MSPRRTLIALALSASIAAGCGSGGGGGGPAAPTTGKPTGELIAQVASYDLAVGRAQRVIVGLQSRDAPGLVSFGTAQLRFAYLGPSAKDVMDNPTVGPEVTAGFLPIAGQKLSPGGPTIPRVVEPSEGVGVYAAEGIRFDRPGVWSVAVAVVIGGRTVETTSTFTVLATSSVPVPGDLAPLSQNHLPGAAGIPPKAVDSRAGADGSVPDPELHTTTVAAAVASGRPTLLVVSTPVYCKSQFCGPVTDSVQALAKATGDRMNFVHIEVWRDFETTSINKAAADWIYPTRRGEPSEPWVFLIGGDGRVLRRWDNVAGDDEVATAVREVPAGG